MVRWLSLWLFLALAGTAAGQDYRIQPGDRLDVTVIEDPSLNRQVLVRPDGKISMPLAGTVVAGGRTPEQVAAAIRSGLARDFVQPPSVTVALIELAQPGQVTNETLAQIYLVGQVRAPGRYDVVLPLDALQALALAGGPDVFAAQHRIQIRRRGESGQTVILFDYDLVEDGAVPVEAIDLQDGDVIVIPERGLFD